MHVDASIRMLTKAPGRPAARAAADRRKTRQGQRAADCGKRSTQAEFANVAIYSLDISTVVAALTDKGDAAAPAAHSARGRDSARRRSRAHSHHASIRIITTATFVPVFVDIFKGTKSLFVDDTLDVFTRFTGGREYSFISEKSLEKAVEGISEEMHSQYLLSYSPIIRARADSTTSRWL